MALLSSVHWAPRMSRGRVRDQTSARGREDVSNPPTTCSLFQVQGDRNVIMTTRHFGFCSLKRFSLSILTH